MSVGVGCLHPSGSGGMRDDARWSFCILHFSGSNAPARNLLKSVPECDQGFFSVPHITCSCLQVLTTLPSTSVLLDLCTHHVAHAYVSRRGPPPCPIAAVEKMRAVAKRRETLGLLLFLLEPTKTRRQEYTRIVYVQSMVQGPVLQKKRNPGIPHARGRLRCP